MLTRSKTVTLGVLLLVVMLLVAACAPAAAPAAPANTGSCGHCAPGRLVKRFVGQYCSGSQRRPGQWCWQ